MAAGVAWLRSRTGLRRAALATVLALTCGATWGADLVVQGVRLDETGDGRMLSLDLDRPVRWRVVAQDAPPRLDIDLSAERVVAEGAGRGTAFQVTSLRRGVSRLVVPLPAPMRVARAGVHLDPVTGSAALRVALAPVDAAAAGAAVPRPAGGSLSVILDPGHGGRDRGATHGGIEEADIVLALAQDLAALLAETAGISVRLTRDDDSFLPLADRVALAEAAGGDLLISLHADAVVTGSERGASVYVRGDAGDRWIAVRREGDLVPQTGQAPPDPAVDASAGLAAALVEAIDAAGLELTLAPEREADFVVLRSTVMPSVLVELGYLTDPGDRARLADPAWRLIMARALRDGLIGWLAAAPQRR